jgi:hypothetical protein
MDEYSESSSHFTKKSSQSKGSTYTNSSTLSKRTSSNFLGHSISQDFTNVQKQYTRRLVRGRHPKSFPHQSELWVHCKNSLDRVDLISKGHSFWNIVEEEHEKNRFTEENKTNNQPEKKPIIYDEPEILNKFININGFEVNTTDEHEMTFGQRLSIMSHSGDEILCVDTNDHFRCKLVTDILPSDRICFRLLDLTNPDSMGKVSLEQPLWLQIIDSAEFSDEYNWTNGSLLGTQLLDPPTMTAVNNRRKYADDTEDNKDIINNNSNSSNVIHITKSDNINSNINSVNKSTSTTNTTNTSTSAIDEINKPNSEEIPTYMETTPVDPSQISTSHCVRPDSPVQEKASSLSLQDQGAKIVGGLQPVKICDRGIKLKDMPKTQSTSSIQFYGKSAFILGQWTILSALRKKTKQTVVSSQQPFYIVQDLYCMSSSSGSTYSPWSPNSNEPYSRICSVDPDSPTQIPLMDPNKELEDFTEEELKEETRQKELKRKNNQNKHVGEYGCVRNIRIRDPPFEHVVDRRCVWRFNVIDNELVHVSSLSNQDKIAHRVLSQARDGLKQSEETRKGARRYNSIAYHGTSLPGGERFSTALRQVVADSSLESENNHLKLRRLQEKNLKDHFGQMIVGNSTYEGGSVDGASYSSNDDLDNDLESVDSNIFSTSLPSLHSTFGTTNFQLPPKTPESKVQLLQKKFTSLNNRFANDKAQSASLISKIQSLGQPSSSAIISSSSINKIDESKIIEKKFIESEVEKKIQNSFQDPKIKEYEMSPNQRFMASVKRVSSYDYKPRIRESDPWGEIIPPRTTISAASLRYGEILVKQAETKYKLQNVNNTGRYTAGNAALSISQQLGVQPIYEDVSPGEKYSSLHKTFSALTTKVSDALVSNKITNETMGKDSPITPVLNLTLKKGKNTISLVDPSVVAKRLQILEEEEERIVKAMQHRERCDQFQKLSSLFEKF